MMAQGHGTATREAVLTEDGLQHSTSVLCQGVVDQIIFESL